MINNNFNDIALQLIKSSASCPICAAGNSMPSKKGHTISAQILDKDEEKSVFYLKCSSCGASMISTVSASENGGNAIVFMTDLSPNEISKFRKQQPINIDDVKEMQYLINNK